MGVLLIVLVHALTAFAITLRVPADYATIQSALNDVDDGDTVLVDVGTYAEAIITPPRSFVLRGNVEPDTGDYPRPVIDPSTLTNPTTRVCMTVNGGAPVIEDLVLRNGPEMYPRQPSAVGGVMNGSANVLFRRCVFDSTHIGVWSENYPVTLERCRFISNVSKCVDMNREAITATDCWFDGHSAGWTLLECGSFSSFLRCRFTQQNSTGHLFIVEGHDILFRECIVGPLPLPPGAAQNFYSQLRNSVFEHNVFVDCVLGSSMLNVGARCDSPVVIRGNEFRNLRSRQLPSTSAMCIVVMISEDLPCENWAALIEDNTFVECKAPQGSTGILFHSALVRHNRFTGCESGNESSGLVTGWWHGFDAPYLVADNLFYVNTGYAAHGDMMTLNASWNWWGDSTGPHHPVNNPEGLGDNVSNWVMFDPWHTDTSFFWNEAAEPPLPLPREVNMEIYPQPFNANATLRLIVSQPKILRVELFDVLGRRGQEIWSGAVGSRKDIALDGTGLTSGIYFARASDIIANRSVSMAKLVVLK